MTAAAQPSAARAIADITAGTILASVEIAVPIERVFQAITSEEVTRWWGAADSYRTTEWSAELRPGGKWRAGGVGKDGKFSVGGEILEINPPHTLVKTWNADWDPGNTTTVTYRLNATAIGTRVTVRHDGFAGRPDACNGHTAGWERVLGWLADHFVGVSRKPDESPSKYFLVRLLPPRPTFPMDMTADEARVMQEHVVYWRQMLAAGKAIVFGPVGDPAGAWGMGVLRVRDERELAELQSQDPAKLSGLGFGQEALPMLNIVHG